MRVVIDTNVLISATFWTGKPKQLLNKVRHKEVTFLTSEVLLDELKEVLVRKDKPFKLSAEEALLSAPSSMLSALCSMLFALLTFQLASLTDLKEKERNIILFDPDLI